MLYQRKVKIIVFTLIISLLSGCSSDVKNKKPVDNEEVISRTFINSLKGENLVEEKSVYKNDKPDSIVHLYVTVLKENNILDGKITTLKDLNNFNYNIEGKEPKVEVVFQEGSIKGPESGYFGYGTKTANATMEVRGHSSSLSEQKSYKLRLYDKAGQWNYQSVINLNKHPRDLTRVRNKLSFDYFKIIPDMTSLRTQFVNLHVKDLSEDALDKEFIDYGLYTQIEQPNRTFLKSHGLDPNGNLYKAEFFEFYRYPDNLKTADDPEYKKSEFEKNLSIEGSEDHTKVLEMLDDVNDYSKDINEVIDRHFNRDNLLTWLAANILMGNIDTTSQNFLLYSPVNSDTWYFMPWDYDGAWGHYTQLRTRPRKIPQWQIGLSNYWGMVLFNRLLRDPGNIELLSNKVESLSQIINKDKTSEFLNLYYEIVNQYVHSLPDIKYLPYNVQGFDIEYRRIADETEKNKKLYYENLQRPMPFYLGDPVIDSNKILFEWGRSFDIQADNLTYTIEISTDPDFTGIIFQKEGLVDNEFVLNQLLEGIYYWRVIAKDSKGNEQIAFDVYTDSSGNSYFGIKQFTARKQ